MEVHLWRGVVAAIHEDSTAAGVPLVLQVTNLRPFPGAPESGWRAMTLSDGDHFLCGALPPDAAGLSMRAGAVVRVPQFEFRLHLGERLIIPKELEVLQTEWVTIGNPKLYQQAHWEGEYEELDPQLASSSSELSTGGYSAGHGLEPLLARGMVVMFQQPVMQVVHVMRSEQENLEKFLLVLSDGVHTQNATLASHLNRLVKNSHIRMGSIVRLLEFMCNTVHSPSMVSVIQLEVLQTYCELIGRPKAYELCCIGKPYGLQIKCGEPYHGSVPKYAQSDNASYCNGQGLKWILTEGAVVAMLEGKMAVEQDPVMQVVDIALVCKIESPVHCVLLSDGVYQKHALLYEDTDRLVELNWLRTGSIVRVLRYNCDNRIIYSSGLSL